MTLTYIGMRDSLHSRGFFEARYLFRTELGDVYSCWVKTGTSNGQKETAEHKILRALRGDAVLAVRKEVAD